MWFAHVPITYQRDSGALNLDKGTLLPLFRVHSRVLTCYLRSFFVLQTVFIISLHIYTHYYERSIDFTHKKRKKSSHLICLRDA